MKKSILILFFIFVSFSLFSQKIFETKNKYEADKLVFISDNFYESDLKVYITSNKFETKKDLDSGIWYFTKSWFEADYKIYFTKNKFEANLKISFTLNKFTAGKVTKNERK